MSDSVKIFLSILVGIVIAIAVFCLIVVISCAVNGLAFGDQICHWFSTNSLTPEDVEGTIRALNSMPIM